MRKYADVRVNFTVFFDDDGVTDLMDQAFEAVIDQLNFPSYQADIEVIGDVRDEE